MATDFLKGAMERRVSVLTMDGRNIIGTLRGFDAVFNIVLSDAVERVFSPTSGVETVELGLYVVRGESVCVVGEVDDAADEAVAWGSVQGEPLREITFGR